MLDRKYKPKTKKRTLHKRTRKHVKQFGGAQKPLGNTVLPPKRTVKSAIKFFETRMYSTPKTSRPSNVFNLQSNRIVSKIVAGIQGAPQLPSRAYKNRMLSEGIQNPYTRVDNVPLKANPIYKSNILEERPIEPIYKNPEIYKNTSLVSLQGKPELVEQYLKENPDLRENNL